MGLSPTMDNITVNEVEKMKLIAVYSFGLFGGLGAMFNLILICYQLTGFKKRKPYEYILFALTIVCFVSSIAKCCVQTYAITCHNDIVCIYAGLLNVILTCSAMMLLTVNMLHRYLMLYYPIVAKRISTNRGLLICTTLPISINIACYTPLLLFNAYGRDNLGTCSMKPFTSNNRWVILLGVELFTFNIVNIILGVSVIWKIRGHSNHVQKLFKSQIVNESKQIVKLMTILTIVPVFNYTIGFVVRLFTVEMVGTLWIRGIPLVINPLYFVMTPVIMIAIIKDYKNSFMGFLWCASNQVVAVEPINLNIEKTI